MGARQKLNAGYALGSLILATVLGVVFQSFTVFILALVVFVGCNLYLGEIRPNSRR
jgi:hypothetical protein